ncbi:hypothetical protein M0802_012610 [Mischocyttarus mexicanus]|nr:hypothetical protein M0802_012610 [Mischocyttarus mexicanus]
MGLGGWKRVGGWEGVGNGDGKNHRIIESSMIKSKMWNQESFNCTLSEISSLSIAQKTLQLDKNNISNRNICILKSFNCTLNVNDKIKRVYFANPRVKERVSKKKVDWGGGLRSVCLRYYSVKGSNSSFQQTHCVSSNDYESKDLGRANSLNRIGEQPIPSCSFTPGLLVPLFKSVLGGTQSKLRPLNSLQVRQGSIDNSWAVVVVVVVVLVVVLVVCESGAV